MKKIWAAVLALMLLSTAALADGGSSNWVNTGKNGQQPLSVYAGSYDGYVNVDGWGSGSPAQQDTLTVISKAASVWSEPRTNSKKLASLEHGEGVFCIFYEGSSTPVKEGSFYQVDYDYKGHRGWVNEDYVVLGTTEIILMESNVPAYIAPDVHAKKVGSLSKLTRYPVIGIYDDFYIINLRGAAAAFIPMDVKHYDNSFEYLYRQASTVGGTVDYNTALRTGPGEDYPEIKEMKAGATFECIDVVDGYYMTYYSSKSGSGYAFIDSAAATVPGM